MANRTERTTHTEVLLAQQHRAEHDTLTRRLGGVDQELQRLNGLITERNAELTQAASEAMREIVRTEIERLENQIAERGNERQDILQRLSDVRQDLDNLTGRVGTVENNVLGLGSRVDGLQAHSEAHATAITQLQHRLSSGWWQPIVAGIGAFFIAWLFLEALGNFPLWRDLVLSGAAGLIVAGIVAGLVGGGAFHGVTQVHAGAAAGVNTIPAQPPAPAPAAPTPAQVAVPPQPVVLTPDAVIPPPPPTGTQFQTVQAAAAASASTN